MYSTPVTLFSWLKIVSPSLIQSLDMLINCRQIIKIRLCLCCGFSILGNSGEYIHATIKVT